MLHRLQITVGLMAYRALKLTSDNRCSNLPYFNLSTIHLVIDVDARSRAKYLSFDSAQITLCASSRFTLQTWQAPYLVRILSAVLCCNPPNETHH